VPPPEGAARGSAPRNPLLRHSSAAFFVERVGE